MSIGQPTEDFWDEIEEYLEGCADVVDGSYGEPHPNRAMQLLQSIPRMREELSRVIRDARRYDWLRGRDKCGERTYRVRNLYGHHLDQRVDAELLKDTLDLAALK